MSNQINTEKKLVENYLTQHQLEKVINEIVNRCVRNRPKDPFDFLSRAVAEKSTSTKGVTSVEAYQVLTGRGNPTLSVEVKTDKGVFESQVPSRIYDSPFLSAQEVSTGLANLPSLHTSSSDTENLEQGSGEELSEDQLASADAEAAESGDPDPAVSNEPAEAKGPEEEEGRSPAGAEEGCGFYKELREVEGELYEGRGVGNAVELVRTTVGPRLIGLDPVDQEAIDEVIASLDPSEDKQNVGANTCLATSIAICRAGARAKGVPLYRHLATLARNSQFVIPVPSFALVTGGKLVNATNTMAFEQICLLPTGAENFAEALHIGHAVHRALGGLVEQRQKPNVSSLQQHYDGSFILTHVSDVDQILELLLQAIGISGFLDKAKLTLVANAESFYLSQRHAYEIAFKHDCDELAKIEKRMKGEEFLQMYRDLLEKYPDIVALEEPFGHSDIESYRHLTEEFGETTQIAGDCMIDGRPLNIQKAVASQSCNSVVLKLSHVSTVTEMIRLCKLAQNDDFGIILSSDASEANDDFLAHLAVAMQVGVLKCGAPIGGEFIAKYNALAKIEQQLGEEAFYAADRFREPV